MVSIAIQAAVGFAVFVLMFEFTLSFMYSGSAWLANQIFNSGEFLDWSIQSMNNLFNFGGGTTTDLGLNGVETTDIGIWDAMNTFGEGLLVFMVIVAMYLYIKKVMTGLPTQNIIEIGWRIVMAVLLFYYWDDFYDYFIANVLHSYMTDLLGGNLSLVYKTMNTITFSIDIKELMGYLTVGGIYSAAVIKSSVMYVERYVNMMATLLLGPVCIPMYIAPETEHVFKSWRQSVFSQLLGLILSLFFTELAIRYTGNCLTAGIQGKLMELVYASVLFELGSNSEKILNQIGIQTTHFGETASQIGHGFMGSFQQIKGMAHSAGHFAGNATRLGLGLAAAAKGQTPQRVSANMDRALGNKISNGKGGIRDKVGGALAQPANKMDAEQAAKDARSISSGSSSLSAAAKSRITKEGNEKGGYGMYNQTGKECAKQVAKDGGLDRMNDYQNQSITKALNKAGVNKSAQQSIKDAYQNACRNGMNSKDKANATTEAIQKATGMDGDQAAKVYSSMNNAAQSDIKDMISNTTGVTDDASLNKMANSAQNELAATTAAREQIAQQVNDFKSASPQDKANLASIDTATLQQAYGDNVGSLKYHDSDGKLVDGGAQILTDTNGNVAGIICGGADGSATFIMGSGVGTDGNIDAASTPNVNMRQDGRFELSDEYAPAYSGEESNVASQRYDSFTQFRLNNTGGESLGGATAYTMNDKFDQKTSDQRFQNNSEMRSAYQEAYDSYSNEQAQSTVDNLKSMGYSDSEGDYELFAKASRDNTYKELNPRTGLPKNKPLPNYDPDGYYNVDAPKNSNNNGNRSGKKGNRKQ